MDEGYEMGGFRWRLTGFGLSAPRVDDHGSLLLSSPQRHMAMTWAGRWFALAGFLLACSPFLYAAKLDDAGKIATKWLVIIWSLVGPPARKSNA